MPTTKPGGVAMSIRIPDEQHLSLGLLASVQKKAINTLVNEAIEKMLSETPGLSDLVEHAQRTGAMIKDSRETASR